MAVDRQFLRGVSLTLAKPLDGDFFRQGGDVVRITGLRVMFNIAKTIKRDPNTCTASVFNLAEATRKLVNSKPVYITIDAGYDGRLTRLFTGDLFHGTSHQDGPTWETKLQLADGARAFAQARVSRSYNRGVNAHTALKEIASSMGLTLQLSASVEHTLRAEFAAGVVLDGFSRDQMSRILAPHRLSWSIQEGELIILGENEYRSAAPIRIAQDTGMIGSPEFGVPEKEGQTPTLTVRSTLKPDARAGGLIQVASRHVNGVFKVHRLNHEGDTNGEVWQTTFEAKSIS